MSLLLSEVDGSPSAELMDLSEGRWLTIFEGDIHAFPAVRGENVTIPQKPGQTVMPVVEDHLVVKLGGPVWGDGATPALARASYRARLAALRAVLGYAGKVVRLTASPPVMGLTGAETATIDVQFKRWVLPELTGWEVNERLELHFECVTDPPAWTVA